MGTDLQGMRGWATWRYASTEDGSIPVRTTDAAGNHAGWVGGIGVHPYSAIAVRMFGTNTDGDTATMTLYGSMDDQRKFGTGPMQELWRGRVFLGSYQVTTTSAGRPINDGKWPAAVYLEVDTYDIGVSGGHNAAKAVVLSGAGQAMLLLPTLGYTSLGMGFTAMDGTGTEITTLGAIYRAISMGGVV